MGSKEEWQNYQDALKRGDKAAAAAALKRYQAAKQAEGGGGSKPTLVNLSTKDKAYPNAIPIEQVPDVMMEDPEFFDLVKRATEGK